MYRIEKVSIKDKSNFSNPTLKKRKSPDDKVKASKLVKKEEKKEAGHHKIMKSLEKTRKKRRAKEGKHKV
jgi:hypothetical protein